jgi:putative ABC transport system substrate-binding protein
MRRIGYLYGGTRADAQPYMDAFVNELRMIGWIEGANLAIEWRIAETHNELLPELAVDLVQLPVEVIVTPGSLATDPASQATSTIPIVMLLGPEPTAPAAPGLFQGFARPGGNITGTTGDTPAYNTKSVELIKTLLPHLSRLAILTDESTPNDADVRPVVEHAAQMLGIQVSDWDMPRAPDVDSVFEAAQTWGADAGYVIPVATLQTKIARISALAAQTHMPVIYPADAKVVAEYGGLMDYGPDFIAAYRQGADYVDKILRGARPVDVPVQAPLQYDFIVNIKAAQDLGITFPPDVAAQVTQWVQ